MGWKGWFFRDYARYLYVILALAIIVFGLGEVLRVQPNPAAPLTLILWGLLLVAVIVLLIIVYILLWRRDSPTGKTLAAFFSLRPRED